MKMMMCMIASSAHGDANVMPACLNTTMASGMHVIDNAHINADNEIDKGVKIMIYWLLTALELLYHLCLGKHITSIYP